ncbi:hypothetical protein [Cellulomonas sp. URHE0023]|uniref:hypothetical protein n=1 Tax=Cellulomonas sp. URHE0023 TaxID=1380354 RepID=UPI000483151A|nr:hypothetical protein [Cellulomonas sp. URHE0023]
MTEDEARPDLEVPADDAIQPVKDLLAEHVPLALLVDLVTPESTSAQILEDEGLPEDAWWEQESGPAPAGGAPDPEA